MTHDAPTSFAGTPTAAAISPDSGRHWSDEGAWEVEPGLWRIPLPLPMDGLKAINVYALAADDGLTLVDGGWAIPQARALLDECLRSVGSGFGDIRRFLVTHIHRDHYTMARVLGTELGVPVSLGRGDEPGLHLLNHVDELEQSPFLQVLVTAGAHDLAEQWAGFDDGEVPDPALWAYPDVWLEGDQRLEVGARTLDAVHTPGHTPGHYVFADAAGGVLFAGDHVLPTITPSIGFTVPPVEQPLRDFMASLTRVRALPDLRILPAHGPVAPSSHARVDELLAHHERRLEQSLAALGDAELTSQQVAVQLGWTRHERAFAELDPFAQGMAAMETKAHLDLLVARGQAEVGAPVDGAVRYRAAG
ncbi:MBL fold metallo-hydrolase [Nocardioides sp. TRM66260-LWL]|uniref:MBL fold metallo-hydrolase n=1 Tax=Nocardioides sp. TRM66260-LWL TaxID=2874478 RepID=UPI001CC3E462|nr:MBL fold metallo-hydrolase [Nocardioides sp. TRM66260-LWL]MBZ5734755.1 MBL fold metallo-hydrolase [Nocardioides sp. TRM66260-LWL]